MDTFYQVNAGFHSRVAHHLDFPDYSLEELLAIAERMVTEQQYTLDDGSRRAFREYLELRITQPHFANARSVRNAIDRAKLRQAARVMRQGGVVPTTELARIAEEDIRASRVFTNPGGA